MTTFFGPIVSNWNVEQAVVSVLKAWMPTYLAEVERQNSLQQKIIYRPPTPESYHGGVDFESWKDDELPSVIVIAEPFGLPDYKASAGGYEQCYEVKVGCVHKGTGSEAVPDPEDEARMVAAHYGAATMLLVQVGIVDAKLGEIPSSDNFKLVELPHVTLPKPDRREIALATTTFHVWVSQSINDSVGPMTKNPEEAPGFPGDEEPWPEEPKVTREHITITAEPLDS